MKPCSCDVFKYFDDRSSLIKDFKIDVEFDFDFLRYEVV